MVMKNHQTQSYETNGLWTIIMRIRILLANSMNSDPKFSNNGSWALLQYRDRRRKRLSRQKILVNNLIKSGLNYPLLLWFGTGSRWQFFLLSRAIRRIAHCYMKLRPTNRPTSAFRWDNRVDHTVITFSSSRVCRRKRKEWRLLVDIIKREKLREQFGRKLLPLSHFLSSLLIFLLCSTLRSSSPSGVSFWEIQARRNALFRSATTTPSRYRSSWLPQKAFGHWTRHTCVAWVSNNLRNTFKYSLFS